MYLKNIPNKYKTHSKKKHQTQTLKVTSEIVQSSWVSMEQFLHHVDPDIRKIIRKFECFQEKIIKRKKISDSVVFNGTCLNNDLLPKYIIYIYIYIYIGVADKLSWH